MAIGLGHHQPDGFAGASSITGTALTIADGSSICVLVVGRAIGTSHTAGASDTKGNAYTQRDSGAGFYLFTADNVTGDSALQVTITFDSAVNPTRMNVIEITGTSGFDVEDSTASASATSVTATTAATSVADELVITAATAYDASGTSSLATDGATAIDSNLTGASTVSVFATAYNIVSTTGAQSSTATISPAKPITAIVATFKQASDTTASLAGSAATAATGTLAPVVDCAVSGSGVAGAAGTLSPAVDVALAGAALAFALGTLTPVIEYPLTGTPLVAAAGTLVASGDTTVALTGASASFGLGVLAPLLEYPLTGTSILAGAGTMVPGVDVPLLGSSAAFATGSLAPSSDSSAALTGVAATFGLGMLTPVVEYTLTTSGLTVAAGTLGSIGGTDATPAAPAGPAFSRPRVYSLLDRARVGPGLIVGDDDLTVTTLNTCDINRTILGTQWAASGAFAFESYFWSVSRGDMTGMFALGIAQANAALDKFVGFDNYGIGWFPVDGTIKVNNTVVVTGLAAQQERTSLGVMLVLGPGYGLLSFVADGSPIYTYTLSGAQLDKLWYPAFSLGSASPGDVSAIVNFGANRFDRVIDSIGWSQQRAGLATIYVSLSTEGFLSSSADTPANQPFKPRLLNAGDVVIDQAAQPFVLRSGDYGNPSSVGTVQLDNSDGTYDALLAADVRDSVMVIQTVDATNTAGSLAAATTEYTAIIDGVSSPNTGIVEVQLRGPLSAFDRPMKMRVLPPFVENAGKVRPIGLGAQRNVEPLCIDSELLTYVLGDAPMTNVPLVTVMGAPLDPLQQQFVPSLDGEGLTLATPPQGRVSADCSSVGAQYQSGNADVLGGIGAFASWAVALNTNTSTPPDGWDWSTAAYPTSFLQKRNPVVGNPLVSLFQTTQRTWYPPTSIYGEYISTESTLLLAGRSYRLTMNVIQNVASAPDPNNPASVRGGFMVRTAISNDAADAVTTHGVPVTIATGVANTWSVDFTVPYGTDRKLYILGVATSGTTAGSHIGSSVLEIANITLELLGQFASIPLTGITVTDAFKALLVDRDGQDASVFSASDAASLDVLAQGLGMRYEDTPNLLDALIDVVDDLGAFLFEAPDGTIRARMFVMPDSVDSGNPVAAFSDANIAPGSIQIIAADAAGLTTRFGARPNCAPFGDSDFVTDTALVPLDQRAAWKAPSQYQFSANPQPAQEYAARIGNTIRVLRFDDPSVAAGFAGYLCGQFQTRRMLCTFTALTDGRMLGAEPAIERQLLVLGDPIMVDVPSAGLDAVKMTVVRKQTSIGAGTVIITGIY